MRWLWVGLLAGAIGLVWLGVARGGEGQEAIPAGGERLKAAREHLKNLGPDERRRLLEQWRRDVGDPEGRPSVLGGGFAMRFLNENEEFIRERGEHQKTMRAIEEELRALHEAVGPKLRDPNIPREEKRQIIADTRVKARALLGKILDEMMRHQKAVNDLFVKYREQILDSASEMVFRGPAAGGPGPQPGDAPGGKRRLRPGEDAPPPPPPPMP